VAEFPSLPLFTDAYLGDTTHLSTFEHGAYLLLLIVSWRSTGCRMPDDDALLARYTRMTRDKWRKTRPILEPFFQVRDGFWHQARLQDEFQHLQSRREQQREAGNASALAKSLKRANRGSASVTPALQREVNAASTPFTLPSIVPLSKDNGAEALDDDARFWADAKAYMTRRGLKNPGAMIGKWVRDHGKPATAEGLTAAQLERPAELIQFMEGWLRQKTKGRQEAWESPC
jgi:uncharacterized protein YdaU (DUF1376 family)